MNIDTKSMWEDDGIGRSAEYESLLDIYTVISLVLILAGFLYVNQTGNAVLSKLAVNPSTAAKNGSGRNFLSENMLFIVVFRENEADKISIRKGENYIVDSQTISNNKIDFILNEKIPSNLNGVRINVGLFDNEAKASREIFVEIQSWFAKKNQTIHCIFTSSN